MYAESSAVLRWLFRQPQAESIFELLRGASTVLSSALTLAEVQRSIRRALAGRFVTDTEAIELTLVLSRAASTWTLLAVDDEVLMRVGQPFPSEPVRTLDAIHLATILGFRRLFPDLVVLSTDLRVRTNCTMLSVGVVPG